MIRFSLLALAMLLAIAPISAQNSTDWVEQMNDPTVNFYTVQQSFEQYWEGKEIEKGKGWKQFKRWEAFMEPRVFPDGERPSAEITTAAYNWVFGNNAATDLGQWKPIGPFNGPSLGGIGRVNRIVFDPQNSNIVWIGTPAGGLWKSTDGGQNWTTNTDKLTNLGISDIAIHPTNSNIMYIATGDRDAGDTYSYGVLKSIDGGTTWTQTGLTHNVTQQTRITDLYINPDSPSIILASSYSGIFRSTDAGTTWTSVKIGSHNEIVQMPGNPNVLFVSSLNTGSCRIFKSTDNGLNWTQASSSVLPLSNSRRIELAVTPDDSNYVYALYGNNNNGFAGVYRSTDAGTTWTLQASSPNLLGWSTTGADAGGQAWYDLALAVNPTDKNELFVGGVNIWSSQNGGSSWNLASHWYGGGGAPYVHADVHDLEYNPTTGDLYAGTDGGVYRDTDNQHSWDALNDGINISQYYKFSNSLSDTTHIVAGAQDNGTHYRQSNGWTDIYGGDGMDCAIDTKDPNTVYVSVYYGDFSKSTNGGNSFRAPFNLPPAGNGNWVTPFSMDPLHPDTLYAGFNNVWRSFDGGVSFTSLNSSGVSGGGNVDVLAIAPQHTNVVFMANGSNAWKSMDHGVNWTYLNFGGSRSVTGIAAAHDSPDHIVATKSGYISTDKVYESKDGGATFSNISAGLPNIPINCVVIENNAVHGVYIGTDLGVFYKDDSNPSWVSFNFNLPNVIVNELEINYINNKLRAATYGRGVWESPVYGALVAPVAQAEFSSKVCVNDTITLTHNSQYSPDQFNWNITPSTFTYVNGTSSISENPEVVFTQKDVYNVSLSVSNSIGGDSIYYQNAIAAGGLPISYSIDFSDLDNVKHWNYDQTEMGWENASSSQGMSFRANLFGSTSNTDYELISPALDLGGHDSAWMAYDYAYSGTATNTTDSLLIYASTGCSDSWTLISVRGEDGTGNFQTTSGVSTKFNPTANEWCHSATAANCLTVNLSAFAGQEGVRVKFVAVNNGGNDIYLDNVLIEGNPTLAPSPDFSSVQSTCALDTVVFNDQTYGSANTWEWTFTGPSTFTSSDQNPKIRFTQAGTYSVKLKAGNAVGSDSITKTSFINVLAADSVSISLDYTGTFTCTNDTLNLTATVANSGSNPEYTWYLNNVNIGKTSSLANDFTQLLPGDEIYATVLSDATCAFPAMAYSDTIIINVYAPVSLNITSVNSVCKTNPPLPLTATPAGGQFSGPGVSGSNFDPAVAGAGQHTITYTYQDANGCSYSSTTMAQVSELPTITITNNLFCESDGASPLNIAVPAGGTYSGNGIYNNNIFPDSLGAGLHPITYTYNSGSCGIVTKTFDVDILPNPTPTAVVHPGYLECDITATSYQWYTGNGTWISGANAKTYTPTSNGSYRVDVLDANGCYGQSAYTSFSIGLEELPVGFEFGLYPNPANDVVNLKMDYDESVAVSLNVSDLTGKVIRQQNIQFEGSTIQQIDLSNLPQGVYVFRLEGANISVSKKVVVKH